MSPYTTWVPLPIKALFTCQCHHTPPGLPSPQRLYLPVSVTIHHPGSPPPKALFTCQCHHTSPGLPSPQRLYLPVSVTIHHQGSPPQKKLYLPVNVTIHFSGSPPHKGSIYLSVSPYTTRAPLPPKALFTCQCRHTPPGLPICWCCSPVQWHVPVFLEPCARYCPQSTRHDDHTIFNG